MKFNSILSLFFVFFHLGFLPIKSLETTIANTKNENYATQKAIDSIKLIKNKISVFSKKKDYKNAIVYSKKLLKRAKIQSDSALISNAYWRQGFYFKKMYQLDSAYFYLDKSYTLNLLLKDSIRTGDRLLDMANIQKGLGDYNGGMITATEGLRYLENSKEIESLIGLYQIISVCQKELGNTKEALRWNTKVINVLNSNIASGIVASDTHTIKITRANILAAQKEFHVSLTILDSIAASTKEESLIQYSRAICNIGYYKWLENKNNTESEALLLNALQIRQELNTVSGLISSNIHLAEYYFDNNKTKALLYANEAFNQSKKLDNSVALLESLDLVLALKTDLGQDVSQEAIFYSKEQNKLEKTKQSIRAIYAASKYDNDTLEKKNLKLLAEVAIKEKQSIIAISIACLFLLLIGFIIYIKNQQKTRIKLEETYKTELRLSKKIHDELGNDIFYLMTQIQKEAPEPTKNNFVLNSLDSIYTRIRDISKEFTPINTDTKFGEDLISLLNSYSSNSIKIITKEVPSDFWNGVPKQTKIEIFRVVQELLTNMKKHSQATFVALTSSKNKNKFTLKYVDNGIGFNPNSQSSGIGLKNAENRMRAINGSIIFDKKQNEGVTAILTFSV